MDIREKNKNIITYSDNDANKSDENINKDCIEYGLSNEGLLICTKYE